MIERSAAPGIRVTYEPDSGEFAAALREISGHGAMRIVRWLFGLGIPLVETALILSDPKKRADWSTLAGQLLPWWTLFPALFFGLMWIMRRWTVRRLFADDASQKGAQERVLDDDGYHIRSPGMSANVSWTLMRSVIETKNFFLLFQTRDCAYFLPKRTMAPELVQAARALMVRHLQERARIQTT